MIRKYKYLLMVPMLFTVQSCSSTSNISPDNPDALPCEDIDHDGYGKNCSEGNDCNDYDGRHWSDCGLCVDVDKDGYGKNCDLGDDCNDRDRTQTNDCCPDADSDGYGEDCLAGPDCAPDDPLHWDDCGECEDEDGDGRGPNCDLGDDCTDDDPYHWSDCGGCYDNDGDNYGKGCDLGSDCNEYDGLLNTECDSESGLLVDLEGITQMPSLVELRFKVETLQDKPVTNLELNNFTILEDGRRPSAESNLTFFPSSQGFQHLLVLLIDLSASVQNQYINAVKQGAKDLVYELLKQGYKVSVMSFDDYTQYHTGRYIFSDSYAALEEDIDNMVPLGDSSMLYQGILDALEMIENTNVGIFSKAGSVVVFTDGGDQGNPDNDDPDFNEVRGEIYKSGSDVVFFGLHTSTVPQYDDLEVDIINKLAKDGFAEAYGVSDMQNALEQVLTTMSEEIRKYYIIDYCSLKRSRNHNVMLKVTLSTGLYGVANYSFNADGFLGGCYNTIEDIKLDLYDADSDTYYSVEGPRQDCDDTDPLHWDDCEQCVTDADGDGWGAEEACHYRDCRDDVYAINPGQAELLSTPEDDNCDGNPNKVSFESGALPGDWTTGGSAGASGWRVVKDDDAPDGNYIAVSGDVEPYSGLLKFSYLQFSLDFESPAYISFDWKAGSYVGDTLTFYIDSIAYGTQLQGDYPWVNTAIDGFYITSGVHEIRWEFENNAPLTAYTNAGYLDNIRIDYVN